MNGNGLPIFSLREITLSGQAGNGVPALVPLFHKAGTKSGNGRERAVKKITIGQGVGFPVPGHMKTRSPQTLMGVAIPIPAPPPP